MSAMVCSRMTNHSNLYVSPVHISLKKIIFNWKVLLYNIVLVSDIHQHDSAIGMLMSPSS